MAHYVSGLKIFAKKGTDEKLLLNIPHQEGFKDFYQKINQGKDTWIYIGDFNLPDVLSFKDGITYRGYSPNIEKYVDKVSITNFKID